MRLRLINIDRLPEPIAWPLLDGVYRQRASMLAATVVCIALGVVGWVETGANWYLGGGLYAALIGGWRFRQSLEYERRRERVAIRAWVWRAIVSGWAAALGWAAWSVAIALEAEPRLIALVLGVQAGLIAAAAARNNAIPALASVQVGLTGGASAMASFALGTKLAVVQGLVTLLYLWASLSLMMTMRAQRLRALSSEHEAQVLAQHLAEANAQLELINEHLLEQVSTDPLTGLLNRRAFDLHAATLWRLALRDGHPLSAIMVDIDHFKAFNDRYGHPAGDECLREVARTLLAVLGRPGDVLARYGGEEFIALLPRTTLEGAVHLATRMADSLSMANLVHEFSPLGRISASFGIATAVPGTGDTLAGLVMQADQCLYRAKRLGRNQLCAATEVELSLVA